MLFLATLLIFVLAMAGLGAGLLLGRNGSPRVGCGNDCRCLPEAGDSEP